jgi:putative intracellular protease/amidase/predicted Ser/Thr protein kinase
MVATHPSNDQLRAFAQGRLSGDSLLEMEAHISRCSACCAKLANIPDDTLVCRLRAGATLHATPAQTQIPPVPASIVSGTTADLVMPEELRNHPRYQVVRRLGEGGMGVVFQAVHRMMERDVALKVINSSLISHPGAVERFQMEVKAAAKLQHPNIVVAHDAEQVGSLHFLVMEYVEGVSLDRLVEKRGPLPIEQACHFIRQAAQGLQHAHEKGMVHRDIKPQNLMVTRKGQVKILDFGLARFLQGPLDSEAGPKKPLTMMGTVLGTPDYIAPEQVSDSRTVDTRADIYSLGCTFYFLLTGSVPFPGGTSLRKALAHVDTMPLPVRSLRKDVPPELLPVLDRMMAKRPEDRQQTPAEVVREITEAMRHAATKVADTEVGLDVEQPATATRERRRGRKKATGRVGLIVGLVAGMLCLGLLGGWLLWAAFGPPSKGTEPTSPNTLAEGKQPKQKNGEAKQPKTPEPLKAAEPPRVLLVLPNQDFWLPDYENARRGLEGAGAKVIIAAPYGGTALSSDKTKKVPIDVVLASAKADDYAAVYCSGGTNVAQLAQGKEQGTRLFKEMHAQKKPIAAVCGGPFMLVGTNLLQNGKFVFFPELPQLREEFSRHKLHPAFDGPDIVEHNGIMTGRRDTHAKELARLLVERVKTQKRN